MNQTVKLPKRFISYAQAMQTFNFELPQMPGDIHGGEYGLQRVYDLLSDLGSPQNQMKVVHIAGTSGKGTTAYMIDRLLRAGGLKTGLSVSPFVYDMKERWYVDGDFLSDEVILSASNKVLSALHAAEAEGRLTSRFETIICLAFVLMLEHDVDYFVLETGMGGLLDPTNTVERSDKISVLTTIGLDHTHILGTDLAGIAAHKAGIIQPDSSVFSYQQSDVVDSVFTEAARDKNATLQYVNPLPAAERVTLDPPQFERNAALALAVATHVFDREQMSKLSESAMLSSLRSSKIPGRNERIAYKGRAVILDGAHNAQKIEALTNSLSSEYQNAEISTIAVIAKEQQVLPILSSLCQLSQSVLIVGYPESIVDFKQSAEQAIVEKIAAENDLDITFVSYQEALGHINDSKSDWLVTGSFYHLDWFKKHLI